MSLPTKELRDKVLTVRITARLFEKLQALAERHNLSQADCVEYWIENEPLPAMRQPEKAKRTGAKTRKRS